jgi:hypothetical protein
MGETIEEKNVRHAKEFVLFKGKDFSLQASPLNDSLPVLIDLSNEGELAQLLTYCYNSISAQYKKWARNYTRTEEMSKA